MNDILSAPCEVALEITGRCNLDCKYCFSEKCNQDIQLNDVKKIIDQIDDMNVFEVCISGGEPFLHPDILQILDYCSKKKFNISIVTNGTLIDGTRIRELDDRNLIDVMQVSIDSHLESIHDSVRGRHRLSITNLNLIKQQCDVLPMIGMVIHKQNYNTICESLRILEPLCYQFHLMNIMATKEALNNKELLYLTSDELAETWKQIKKFTDKNSIFVDINDYDLKKKETARFTGCTAGKTKVVVKPNLDVIPCDMVRNSVVDNLKNTSLKETWNKCIHIWGQCEIEPCYDTNKLWFEKKSPIPPNTKVLGIIGWIL